MSATLSCTVWICITHPEWQSVEKVLILTGDFVGNSHRIYSPSAFKATLNGLLVPCTLDMNNFKKVLVKFLSLIVISVVLYPEGFQHTVCFLNLTGLVAFFRNIAKITHLLRRRISTCLGAFNHRRELLLIRSSFKGCFWQNSCICCFYFSEHCQMPPWMALLPCLS